MILLWENRENLKCLATLCLLLVLLILLDLHRSWKTLKVWKIIWVSVRAKFGDRLRMVNIGEPNPTPPHYATQRNGCFNGFKHWHSFQTLKALAVWKSYHSLLPHMWTNNELENRERKHCQLRITLQNHTVSKFSSAGCLPSRGKAGNSV